MSVGLLVNQIRAWFYGAIGTFAPAGVGTLNSPTLYTDPAYVIIRSRPTGIAYAVWYVGNKTAQLAYNNSFTEVILSNVGSMNTELGRYIGYGVIQNMLDAIEMSALYINELPFDYISAINVKTSVLFGKAGGLYQFWNDTIAIADPLSLASIGNEEQYKIKISVLLMHELQHAYDIETHKIGLTELGLLEQSACITNFQFLRDQATKWSDIIESSVADSDAWHKAFSVYNYILKQYDSIVEYYQKYGGTDNDWIYFGGDPDDMEP